MIDSSNLVKLSLRTAALGTSCLLLVAGLAACRRDAQPRAADGILDLKDWDFNRRGSVNLSGHWAFHGGEFLPPAVTPADMDELPAPSGYMKVPGSWAGLRGSRFKNAGHDYGTYVLVVLLPDTGGKFAPALRIREIQSAYTLYVNGDEAAAVGVPGTDREKTVAGYRTMLTAPLPKVPTLVFTLHAANFHQRSGGIIEHIIIGTEDDVRRVHDYSVFIEMFVLGCVFAMGLYHLALWALARREWAVLFFGIFCLIITGRSLVTGNKLLYSMLPGLPWELFLKTEYLTFYVGLPIFALYIYSTFPSIYSRRVVKLASIIGAVFGALVILTPGRVYSWTREAYQVITVVLGIYSTKVLLVAIRRRLDGGKLVMAGFIIFFLVAINDILHSTEIIYTAFLALWGLLVFMFFQALLLARRATQSLLTVERQAAVEHRMHRELLEAHEKFTVSRLGTILGLAKLAEYRDEDTGYHLERIREYCRMLAVELGRYSKYSEIITAEFIDDVYQSSILHDIGKVWVRDSILLKPGPLTDEEFDVIRTHTTKGGDILKSIGRQVGTQSYLNLGQEIAYCHHEKWDGTGYPRGLKGKNIPLSARIVAVADVYDALTSQRPYKPAFGHKKAVSIIEEGRSGHFDPDLVDVFMKLADRFDEIRQNLHEDEKAVSWLTASRHAGAV